MTTAPPQRSDRASGGPVGGLRLAAECTALAIAYVLTARVGQAFAIPPGNVTSIWIPSGLVLAAMILRDGRLWPGVFVGALVGNMWAYFDSGSTGSVAAALLAGSANGAGDALGSALGSRWLRRVADRTGSTAHLQRTRAFLLGAVLLYASISALFGVGSLGLVGLVPPERLAYTALTWFSGDAVGVLLITPALLAWARPEDARPLASPEAGLFLASLAILSAVCLGLLPPPFGLRPPLFVLMPLLLWAVFRLDPRVTFPALVGVAAMSVIATAAGDGPFAGPHLADGLLLLQLFLAVMSSTVLVFRALSEERQAHAQEVEALNAELEARVAARTQQVQAELKARLAAEEAQAQLQRQVLHAQKLESLGILAGGIAHDTSNVLTVVMANAELAQVDLEPGHPSRAHLDEILDAAQRSVALSRQLLAYSGQGAFASEPLDLGAHLEGLKDILRVAVGGRATLHLQAAADLPPVQADPAEVDQLVMNLVINAAEAIGGAGGRIDVDVALADCTEADQARFATPFELPLGPAVRLRVRDTGAGMDAQTRDRLFDPFYTTKATGRGLGMAVVLGIVRGHGGAIGIDTAPGRGTCFEVWLPAG